MFHVDPSVRLKKIILIGSGAIIIALLWVAFFQLWQRESESVVPLVSNPKTVLQKKIQRELEKLERMRESQNIQNPSPEEIKNQMTELEKQRQESGTTIPTSEEIQKELEKIDQVSNN